VAGSMLNFFPELMRTYEVFKMAPSIKGGYGERTDVRKVKGYWSWRKQGRRTELDVEGDLSVPNHQATFWVKSSFLGKKAVIAQNDFVEVDGEMFKVVGDQNFSLEGGFYKCLMQRMPGLSDRQVSNLKVDSAIRSDY